MLGSVFVDIGFSDDVCIVLDRKNGKFALFNFEYHDGTKWIEEDEITFDDTYEFLCAVKLYFSRTMEDFEITERKTALSKMKKDECISECRRLGLSTDGTVPLLRERIKNGRIKNGLKNGPPAPTSTPPVLRDPEVKADTDDEMSMYNRLKRLLAAETSTD